MTDNPATVHVVLDVPTDKASEVLTTVAKMLEPDGKAEEPEPSPDKTEWCDADITALAELLAGDGEDLEKLPGSLEEAALRLLLTDTRRSVPQAELAAKCGTTVPPLFSCDLPALSTFCDNRKLRFPLELTTGDPQAVRRVLSPAQVTELRDAMRSLGRQPKS